MEQRPRQIPDAPLSSPRFVQRRAGRRNGMRLERNAVGPKEAHERLAAPNAHRLPAEIGRSPEPVCVALRRRRENRIAQNVVESLVGIDHQRPGRNYLRKREAPRLDAEGDDPVARLIGEGDLVPIDQALGQGVAASAFDLCIAGRAVDAGARQPLRGLLAMRAVFLWHV